MDLITLENHPKYFDNLMDLYWTQWNDIYKSKGYTSKEKVKQFYKELKDSETYLLIDQEHVKACYTIMKLDDGIYLTDLYVRPDDRSKGLGMKLVNDAKEKVKQQGHRTLYLYANSEMVKWYESQGFTTMKKYNKDEIHMKHNLYTSDTNDTSDNILYSFLAGMGTAVVFMIILMIWWRIVRH